MSDYEYEIPMPDNYRQLLLEIIGLMEKGKTTTIDYWTTIPEPTHHFSIGVDTLDRNFMDNPMFCFDCYGLAKYYEAKALGKIYILTPKAFKWAAYQKKSRLGKWWARLSGNVKDIMLAISFLLALGLTVLQILQALKIIPTP
jgi:hypothetical protein